MAMLRVRSRTRSPSPPAQHIGVFLPPKGGNAENFWRDLERQTAHGAQYNLSEEHKQVYNEILSGGQHSYSDRTVTIFNETLDESVAIGVKTSTTVQEVADLIGGMLQRSPDDLVIKRKTQNGMKRQTPHEEVASQLIVGGLKSFKRKQHKYDKPILVLGGGLGGIQTCIDLDEKGQSDYICMERHADFGGHSWIVVANKFTKLQTEKGTYHVDYTSPTASVPKTIAGMDYKTWPSRDALLLMMREGAREHGLYEKVMFNTSVEMVKMKSWSNYAIQYVPMNEEDGDGNIMLTSAVIAWPGNLIKPNQLEFPGEDDFSGYIETCSFDKVDYKQCEKKNCIIYGHGAFTIENVRTVVEHRCRKVYVVCRKRNLCGMKVVSWMVGQSEFPIPGTLMLDAFQLMYNLVGFDVWSAHSIQTDRTRSFAQISQKTVFGVTDIYFLAGYYGLMEVVVDEIKRLTHHCAHTKKMRKLDVEVILKAIGTSPSFKVDKYLGLKEMVGLWANSDPLRPISCNGMFVQARNFGSFSSGPGFAPAVKMMTWFIDFPEDWAIVESKLPRRKPDDRPAYVPDASYFLPMHMAINSSLPMLAQQTSLMDSLKARKQKEAHPMHEFLPQCRNEWESYIRYFKKHNMVDDRPEPPYPYTEQIVEEMLWKAGMLVSGQMKHEVIEANLYYQPGQEPAQGALQDSAASGDALLPVALLFPGQGSQYVKMMDGVKDIPAVKDMLEKAKPILGYDLLDLCLNGPEEKLEQTRYCQPALFVGGLAGIEKLRGENEAHATRASVMAGLSLGEYTALCAAGVMTFEDGLRLVKLRGEAMQEAAAVGKQKMVSVVGVEREKLEQLCKEAAAKDDGVCQIANCLFPNGFAIGGTEVAINEVKELADKAGAIQSKILKTSGAFHTPLMQPAQDKLSQALEEALPNMQPPKHTVWMNASAEPMRPGTDPKEIVELLKKQLTNPVLWEPSMKAVIDEGITEFYEVGPQKQIKAMMKRIDPSAWKATKNIDV